MPNILKIKWAWPLCPAKSGSRYWNSKNRLSIYQFIKILFLMSRII